MAVGDFTGNWLPSRWGGSPGVVANVLLSVVLICVCLDSLSAIYAAYNRACLRLENESWLRNNCRDPVFFSNMRAHTTVCADVEANARVGAFWAALREVSDDAKAYLQPFVPPVLGIAFICLSLIPLCCLCFQRVGFASSRRLRCIPMHRQGAFLKDV
jgi:hypothetical protein